MKRRASCPRRAWVRESPAQPRRMPADQTDRFPPPRYSRNGSRSRSRRSRPGMPRHRCLQRRRRWDINAGEIMPVRPGGGFSSESHKSSWGCGFESLRDGSCHDLQECGKGVAASISTKARRDLLNPCRVKKKKKRQRVACQKKKNFCDTFPPA